MNFSSAALKRRRRPAGRSDLRDDGLLLGEEDEVLPEPDELHLLEALSQLVAPTVAAVQLDGSLRVVKVNHILVGDGQLPKMLVECPTVSVRPTGEVLYLKGHFQLL